MNAESPVEKLKPADIAIFFGAGISNRPPTNLPLANELTQAIWDGLWCRIKAKWRSFRPVSMPNRLPQFEIFLDCIQAARKGMVTRLLEEICEKKESNLNHRLIAQFGKKGCRLVTTNFDTNVEKMLGKNVETIINDRQCKRFHARENVVPLLKLHGCVTKPNSIIATMSDLRRRGRIRSESLLSGGRQKALREFLQGRTCFVIGYSGGDKLDILPILREVKKCRIILVQHNSCRAMDLENLRNLLLQPIQSSSIKRTNWYDHMENGDTTLFLARLGRLYGIQLGYKKLSKPEPSPASIGKTLSTLAPVKALKAISLVLQTQDRKLAGKLYRRAREIPDMGVLQLFRSNQQYFKTEGSARKYVVCLRRGKLKPIVLRGGSPLFVLVKLRPGEKPYPESTLRDRSLSWETKAGVYHAAGVVLAKSKEPRERRCARVLLGRAANIWDILRRTREMQEARTAVARMNLR